MKKKLLVLTIVSLSIFNLVCVFSQNISANDGDIDFGCNSVSGCHGGATCGGKGYSLGNCVVGCDNGAGLYCLHN